MEMTPAIIEILEQLDQINANKKIFNNCKIIFHTIVKKNIFYKQEEKRTIFKAIIINTLFTEIENIIIKKKFSN